MSNAKRFFSDSTLMVLILSMGLGLGVSGCGVDSSPISQDAELGEAAGIPASEFEPVAFRALSPGGPGSLQEDTAAAKRVPKADKKDKKDKKDKVKTQYEEPKLCTVTELISPEQGGQLLLDWEIKDRNGVTGPKVKVEVKIFPGALDEDTQITISLLNPAYVMVNVELEFGVHGTQFNIPAEVSLDVEGLDLSGDGDGDTLDFYWYDPVADAWFLAAKDEDHFEMDLEQGKIKGIWYIEHFSRYCLAR